MGQVNAKVLCGIVLVSMSAAVACSNASLGVPTSPSTSGTSGATSTTIRGNTRTSSAVHAVQSANEFASHAPTTIRICVTGTTTCADVDGAGNFELTGEFSRDVRLQITSSQGTVMLTISHVRHGELIVVVVNLTGTNGSIQIVSRTGGNDDDDSDDASAADDDEDSADDDSVDDDSSDDDSKDNGSGSSGSSGSGRSGS